MKKLLNLVILLFVSLSAFAFDENDSSPLVPLSYSTSTNYLEYIRHEAGYYVTNGPIGTPEVITYSYNGTNCYYTNYPWRQYVFRTYTTNVPAAIVHSVTWGRGTNAVFVLHSSEVLQSVKVDEPWQCVSGLYYNDATWITKP